MSLRRVILFVNCESLINPDLNMHQYASINKYVFPINSNSLRLSWCRICDRARIFDLHFHDLRHEAISRFFELGLTVPEAASISGHRDARMLLRYAHSMPDRVLTKICSISSKF